MTADPFEKAKTGLPILLIGVGGMLYRAWADLLDRQRIPHIDPPLEDLDLTKPPTIARFVTDRCPLVINCAAWTDVDGAEKNEPAATAINGHGVGDLARRCAEVGSLLVHYSTDYVFDGQSTQPYRTDEPRNPLNAYGRSKALGEELIERSGCQYLIIRTSWLYAPWGKNFVLTIADLASKRDSLKVVADQRGRPTSAQHLADASRRLLTKNARGVYHITDGGECTWFDFASEIVRLTGLPCRVTPCTTADFPRPAKRPAYSTLDLTPTESLLGPMPDWRTNLAAVQRAAHLAPSHP